MRKGDKEPWTRAFDFNDYTEVDDWVSSLPWKLREQLASRLGVGPADHTYITDTIFELPEKRARKALQEVYRASTGV